MAACSADLMECSLCRGEFKDPRALPCLHTFCLNCLALLCDTNQYEDTMKCPMCKEEHGMPENGVQGFRKNFLMNSFMELNKTEEVHVKTTMCQQHPMSELTHNCQEIVCKQAVLCTHCISQNHQNHHVLPMKGISEAKLSHLKVMEEAIKQNYKLVQSTRKKVEENRCEMLRKVHTQVNGYYVTLRQLETQIITDINNKASSRQGGLALRENNLHQAAKQIKALKTKFSDTVPNIVQANADKRLDRDFQRLHEVLDKWSLKYSLLQVRKDVLHFNQFVHRNIDIVIELPEQAVKGVSVGLFEPLVPPVEAKEIVTWKQRDKNVRDIVCHSVGGGSVTVLSSSHLRVYKQNGKMFHSTNHGDKVDRVTTFRECSHAVLDPEKDEIRLYYDWPIFLEKVACVIPESGDVGVGISGTQNYLVYSTWKDSRIKCYSVAYNLPKYLWEWVCKGDSPRCLSALETPTQLLLVVANSLNETTEKSATALFCRE